MHEDLFRTCVDRASANLSAATGSEEWPLRERLTAFFFMLLDAIEELDLPDVSAAFNRSASPFGSLFHEQLRQALNQLMDAPDVPALNRMLTSSAPSRFVAAETLVQLLATSLADASPDRQRSAALVDRTLDFVSTLIINPIPSKAVDLVRYAAEAGYVPFYNARR